jgi:membrane protein DedA with SNARE-associated domain
VFASLIGWLSQHATLLLFVNLSLGLLGVPALSETLLLTAGVMVARDGSVPSPVLLAAILGSAVGMTTCFQMGRFSHVVLVGRLGRVLSARKLARIHRWSHRFGPWSIALAFFAPGLRHITAVAVGATRLEFKRFVQFAVAGACVWSVCILGVGYLMARSATVSMNATSPRRLLMTTISHGIRERIHVVPPPRAPNEIRRLRGDTQIPDFVMAHLLLTREVDRMGYRE